MFVKNFVNFVRESRKRITKNVALRMRCNLRPPEPRQSFLSHYNYDAMPSLKSLNLSIDVL